MPEVQVRGQEALVSQIGLLSVRRVAAEAVPEKTRQQGLGLHGPAALERNARDGAVCVCVFGDVMGWVSI